MAGHFIIVGAGHAAGQAVASLRQVGFEGKITLIGEEPYVPYQRPPLSKKFMAGELGIDRVYFKPPEFYQQSNVDLVLDTRVSMIDVPEKEIVVADGPRMKYDKLLLATGSRPRELNLPGRELAGIHDLRTIADVEGIQGDFKEGAKVVVVGGGYIGLEVAAVAVKRGMDVTVLEMASTVLARVVDPQVAAFFERVHREEGVKIETGVAVSGFEGTDHVTAVTANDGRLFPADFVVVGVGIVPNVELALDAGLKVENGIVVDNHTRTSDPNIFAIGDCCNHPSPLLGHRIRLESVQNALDQAKVAAANMCGGDMVYDQVPWFWSDQYDLKLQIAGISAGYDQAVVRGDINTRSFAVFYLKEGQLIAVDAVNRAPEFMMSKKLIGDRAHVPAERLVDENIKMKEMAA